MLRSNASGGSSRPLAMLVRHRFAHSSAACFVYSTPTAWILSVSKSTIKISQEPSSISPTRATRYSSPVSSSCTDVLMILLLMRRGAEAPRLGFNRSSSRPDVLRMIYDVPSLLAQRRVANGRYRKPSRSDSRSGRLSACERWVGGAEAPPSRLPYFRAYLPGFLARGVNVVVFPSRGSKKAKYGAGNPGLKLTSKTGSRFSANLLT